MRTNETRNITCPFCGQTRTIEDWSDDGRDWMGHGRGSSASGTDDTGCTCALGAIAHKKITLKPMCLNCVYQSYGYCKKPELLKSISTQFDVGSRVAIKQLTSTCEYYKVDVTSIGEKLVKR